MRFRYVRPETQGVSPRTIGRFLDSCEKEVDSLYSYAIVKGAAILSQGFYRPMEPTQMKIMHSVSKSLNSMAVGIAVGEGRLGLDDYLVDYFRDELPEKHDPRVERIRIKHMLMMASSSAYTSASFINVPTSWRASYLGMTPYDEPGRYFHYDTGASYMLSCIVTKTMGAKTVDVLRERVFGPMGIERVHWLEDRDGNSTGGWGCYMTPADMAKIGRLLLDYGAWEGRQLVPAWYMRQALSKRIDTYYNPTMGWPYGYGYQFWMYPERTFGCFGAFGQLIVCSPEKDLYVTTTGGCSERECRRLARIITETIFAESLNEPLPRDDIGYGELGERLDALALPAAEGAASSLEEGSVFGRTYAFAENPSKISSLSFERGGPGTLKIAMTFDGKPVNVEAGHGTWRTFEAPLDTPLHSVHSFTYGWADAKTLVLKQYLCNTSYSRLYRFSFAGDGVVFTVRQNVSLYGDNEERISGKAE